jgi:probable rRNA maturation factor
VAGDENCEVCFVLSNDVEVARLNEQFRGKNGPTNVLSFPTSSSAAFQAQEACEDIAPLGDVIFGLETLSKEAAAQSKTLSHHFTHLAVHGTLHLLGFDHIETHEAAKMEALERKILARIGIADPYGEVKSGNNIDDSHQ